MNRSERAVYNPVQKDTAYFIETAAETGGAYSLLEVDLMPGGGVGTHFHKSYTETFECIEGVMQIECGKKRLTLRPGDKPVTVPKNTAHRFFSTDDKPSRFRVTITPGCRGFEEGLQIAYGLARDGRTNKEGTPTKVSHLGILLSLTESNLPGWQRLIQNILLLIGRRAEKKGEVNRLREAYVRI